MYRPVLVPNAVTEVLVVLVVNFIETFGQNLLFALELLASDDLPSEFDDARVGVNT